MYILSKENPARAHKIQKQKRNRGRNSTSKNKIPLNTKKEKEQKQIEGVCFLHMQLGKLYHINSGQE